MDPKELELRQQLAEKLAGIDVQANSIRDLKASYAADKSVIDAAVETLKALKLEKSSIEMQLQEIVRSNGGDNSATREAFRQNVTNLSSKMFSPFGVRYVDSYFVF